MHSHICFHNIFISFQKFAVFLKFKFLSSPAKHSILNESSITMIFAVLYMIFACSITCLQLSYVYFFMVLPSVFWKSLLRWNCQSRTKFSCWGQRRTMHKEHYLKNLMRMIFAAGRAAVKFCLVILFFFTNGPLTKELAVFGGPFHRVLMTRFIIFREKFS